MVWRVENKIKSRYHERVSALKFKEQRELVYRYFKTKKLVNSSGLGLVH